MTVAELIEKLEKLPPENLVMHEDQEGWYYKEVHIISPIHLVQRTVSTWEFSGDNDAKPNAVVI